MPAIFRAHRVTHLPDVGHGLAEVFSWFILAANHILFLLSVHYIAWWAGRINLFLWPSPGYLYLCTRFKWETQTQRLLKFLYQNHLSSTLNGPKYKCTGASVRRNCYFSDWNLSLPFLPKGMPFVCFCGTLMTLMPQQCAVLWEPRDSKETQNKWQKLSREWLRTGELEEVGGELPSFYTFIRLSHNLAAEKLSYGKNWKKNVGMWSATPGVSANWKKSDLVAPLKHRCRQQQNRVFWRSLLD